MCQVSIARRAELLLTERAQSGNHRLLCLFGHGAGGWSKILGHGYTHSGISGQSHLQQSHTWRKLLITLWPTLTAFGLLSVHAQRI